MVADYQYCGEQPGREEIGVDIMSLKTDPILDPFCGDTTKLRLFLNWIFKGIYISFDNGVCVCVFSRISMTSKIS